MKYSELTSYLELARWENESDNYYTKVYRNGHTVAAVGLLEQYSIRILDPTQMTEGLYRRLSDFAKTPLEEREEERRYWLQRIEPPILGEQDPRYLFYTRVGGYYDIGTTKSEWRNVIKTIFTESEITEMDITGFEKIEVTP